MVHQVYLFIDGIHFGVAIQCSDGWYKFQYAAGGASGITGSLSSVGMFGKTSNKVTIKRSAPTGKVIYIGDTKKGLNDIISYARVQCGFNDSPYGVTDNNCRIFSSKLADYMGVGDGYRKASKGYFFAN